MKPLWIKVLPLFLALIFLNGCATKVPALASISMSLTAVRSEGGRTIATVRYMNESVLSIALAETRHKIYLNGNLIGEGIHTSPIGLASGLPVTEDITVASAAGVSLPTGSASYRMENRLIVLVGDSRVSADSEASGSVTVR